MWLKPINSPQQRLKSQQGAILILVLWSVALITLLVAVLASEVRLSAKAVAFHQTDIENWSKILQAQHLAEMELMIQRMPEDQLDDKTPLSEREYPLLRFNGQPLQLSYPLPDGVEVRIYDHAGLLNIRQLTPARWRDLFRQQIGEDDLERLDALQQAWQDWLDPDDLKQVNGAEKDHYERLNPPYAPRNALPETVEELRLIKGFDTIFKDVNLSAVFTVYGAINGINPNYATPEVLRLLPGFDDKSIAGLLALRDTQEILSTNDLRDLMTPDDLQKVAPWLQYAKMGSNVYTIAITIIPPQAPADSPVPEAQAKTADSGPKHAYLVTVEAKGYALPPKVLRVDPYGVLPDYAKYAPAAEPEPKT